MKKRGRFISDVIVNKVREFYLSDEISRVMPGKRDSISVKTDRGRQNIQKRLLLQNLKDLHASFTKKYAGLKISLSKFFKLRPNECILANENGCHNVCVCKIHQNIKLEFRGLKLAFKKNNYDFTVTYRDALHDMVCENAKPACFLLNCSKCPGAKLFCTKLCNLMSENSNSQVTYMEWITTDS